MIDQDIIHPARTKELACLLKFIKQVKKIGVISIKLGTLEFELDNSAHRPASKVSKKLIEKQANQNQAQADFDEAKDDLAVMHVEDPGGFERALIEREIDDDTLPEVTPLEETQSRQTD